jgi:hypothetical protein
MRLTTLIYFSIFVAVSVALSPAARHVLTHPTATWRFAMQTVLYDLRTNPVRIYAVIAATVALVAHFVPGLPVVLVLALAAAVLGVGEGVRAVVAPMERVVIHADEVPEDGYVILAQPVPHEYGDVTDDCPCEVCVERRSKL